MSAFAQRTLRAGRRPLRGIVAFAALSMLAAGCGSPAHGALSSDGSSRRSTAARHTVQVSAAQQHLAADGSVPFVDEHATDSDFLLAPPPPPDTGGAGSCRAEQLHAELASWHSQAEGDIEGGRRPAPGVYGFVSFTAARPGVRCTLQGQPATELLIDGSVVPLRHDGSITAASKQVVTLVSSSASADLRVDWSPPFCDPPGRQQLRIALPHDGGEVTADVLQPGTPACTAARTETGGELQSFLSPSAFTQHQQPTELSSPLGSLKATMVGAPARASAGQELHFRVRLTNPTGTAIALDPCPGFLLEQAVIGTEGRSGTSDAQLYRLNCRPAASIAAHRFLDFQMHATVPDSPPGPSFTVSWRLLARGLGFGAYCRFSVDLAP